METLEEEKAYRTKYIAMKARLQKAKNAVERQRRMTPINSMAIQRAEDTLKKMQLEFDVMTLPVKRPYIKTVKTDLPAGEGKPKRKVPTIFTVSVKDALKDVGKEQSKMEIDTDIPLPLSAQSNRRVLVTFPFGKLNTGDSFSTNQGYEQRHINTLKTQLKRYLEDRPEDLKKEFLIAADNNKKVRCWRLK
ncbi:MAG: hypothetical protein NT040_11285 [Bacteroidetes bacterium]|nr:hypothetical protein [Bacteroidota bacterium]